MTAYCTAVEIRGALNITSTADDTRLTALAGAVSTRLDRMYNLPDGGFAVAADSTRHFDMYSIADGVLSLDTPLLSVTTLTDGGGQIIPSGGYRLLPLNATRHWSVALVDGYYWTWADNDDLIAIAGKWGWSANVPNDVHEAAIMYAAWLYKRYQAALQDSTANQELGQLIYSEPLPKQVLALLPPRNGKAIL